MKRTISRRDVLKGLGACTVAAALPVVSGCGKSSQAASFQEARFWKSGPEKTVECKLCPIGCTTRPGETGYCGARKNIDGKYYALTYGHPVALHNDPIEKKPFNHVTPGKMAFSIGLTGCNMRCKHCQNWQISQAEAGSLPTTDMTPSRLVEQAKTKGSTHIAFTYNEPTTFTEYMIDCAAAARKAGLGAIVISNGYINQQPQKELVKHLTAYKVDLKGFSESFYREICQAELKNVMASMERIVKQGVWLEIVNLVIPTLNDDPKDFDKMTKWIAANLGKDVPIHFTRFHPMYKLRNLPPTPVSTLEKAHRIATENGLRFVYVGNVPGHKLEHTYCPNCKNLLVKRYSFAISLEGLKDGRCSKCETKIPGVWTLT